jgi:hypothetical protein
MKNLLRKMILGDLEIKDYATITTKEDNIEKVCQRYQGHWFDITQIHWPLALDPFVFGIWIEKDGPLSSLNERQPSAYLLGLPVLKPLVAESGEWPASPFFSLTKSRTNAAC